MQTYVEIQAAIDTLPAAMGAKGLICPEATFEIRADQGPQVCLVWRRAGGSDYDREYHWAKEASPAECISAAHAWITALPSPEERHRDKFLSLSAKAVDYGREHGIDADFINPITESMKRLSENILSDQRAA